MNDFWKSMDPIGDPKMRSPLVSSYILPFLVEYSVIACCRSRPVKGLLLISAGSMECPDLLRTEQVFHLHLVLEIPLSCTLSLFVYHKTCIINSFVYHLSCTFVLHLWCSLSCTVNSKCLHLYHASLAFTFVLLFQHLFCTCGLHVWNLCSMCFTIIV